MNKPLLTMVLALGTTMAAQAAEETVMVEGEGRQIPVTVSLPDGDGPFPFVVMYHGTGSNRHEAGNGYDMLAPKLAAAGIASARFDFAGNGDSTADYKDYTPTGGMDDGLAVIEHMRGLDQIADDRLGVLGWSQGGYVAMLTAARHPEVKSVVTWAGAIDMSGAFAEKFEEAQKNGFAVLEFDWRTPLNASLEWFEQVRDINVAAELANYPGAVLAINGSNDTVVPPATADGIVAASAAAAKKEKAIVEGADHTFNVFSGDLSAYEKLATLTVDWFKSTL